MSDYPAWTPLHHAICGGHTSVAKLLLIAGANHNLIVPVGSASYPKEFTELQDSEATEHGDQHKPFAWFHDPARKAFVQDVHPIHVAAAFGNRSLVKYLMREWGVDIDRLDDNLARPLHHAIAAKNKSMVVYLLSHGADATKPWQLRVDNDAVVSHHNALDFALAFDADCCSAILEKAENITWIETVDEGGHARFESSLKLSLAAFAFEPMHEEHIYTLRGYARTANADLMNYENLLQLIQLVAKGISDVPFQWLRPIDKDVESLSQCPIGTLAMVFIISSTRIEGIRDEIRRVELLIEEGAKLAVDDHSTIACSPLLVLLTRLKYDEDYYRRVSHRSWMGSNLVTLIKNLGYAGGWNTVMEANAQDMVVAVNDFFHAIPEDDRVTLFRGVRDSMPTSLQVSVSKALGVELENDV
ncbi:hypothetical protein N0V92_003911 [Colletotrichum tropicale]|nr:hypothetical protein N0V92_003911 [Colletotrichum tropicale]